MRWLLFPLMALAATAPAVQGQQDGRSKIVADWEKRVQEVGAVRYTVTGVWELKEGMPGYSQIKLPHDNLKLPFSVTVLIDCRAKRYRLDFREDAFSTETDRLVSRTNRTAYDGRMLQTAIPRDLNERDPTEPDIVQSSGPQAGKNLPCYLWPLFSAHGFVPTVSRPARPDKLPSGHQVNEFELRGTAALGGRQCTLLRTEPADAIPALFDEFWVDTERGSAVGKHVYFNGKNPWYRTEVAFQQTPHGWLPKEWTFTWTINGKTAEIRRLRVESLEANPELRNDDFTFPVAPGMIVYTDQAPEPGSGLDPARPSHEVYKLEDNGDRTVIESVGFTTHDGEQLPPASRSYRWLVVGLVAGAALGLTAVWLCVRSRRRAGA